MSTMEMILTKGEMKQICSLFAENGETKAIRELASLVCSRADLSKSRSASERISKGKMAHVVQALLWWNAAELDRGKKSA